MRSEEHTQSNARGGKHDVNRKTLYSGVATIAIAAFLSVPLPRMHAQQNTGPAIRAGGNDLGGVVSGTNGPEAGVWVIAETADLPAKFARIVVTDDRGRYVIPDLPRANYTVWVRGYGLVDSPKVQAQPGKMLNLTAVAAPNAAAAAQYYPPVYWFSLMKVPPKSEFPLEKIKSQGEWLNIVKTGACQSCHPLGTPGMRSIQKELGDFKTSAEAWAKRLQAGSAMNLMARDISRLDTEYALNLFGNWTDRIAGE